MKRTFPVIWLIPLIVGLLACERQTTDGFRKGYYKNGALRYAALYRKGQLDGPYWEFFENGALKVRVRFKKGEPVGDSIAYDVNGKVLLKETYENGRLIMRSDYSGEKVIVTKFPPK